VGDGVVGEVGARRRVIKPKPISPTSRIMTKMRALRLVIRICYTI
jgi:hypothetical protein